MKKLLTLLLVLATAITAYAEDAYGSFKNGGTWSLDFSTGVLYVDVKTIPDYKTVTAENEESEQWHLYLNIGLTGFNRALTLTTAPWGRYSSKIKTIRFSSKVENIGENAFVGLTKVQKVVFDQSTKTVMIGDNAFQYCTHLKTFDFDRITHIGSYAFGTCVELTSNKFPLLVYTESGAFDECTGLANVGSIFLSNLLYDNGLDGFIDLAKARYIGLTVKYEGSQYEIIKRNSAFYITVSPTNLSNYISKFGETPFSGYPNCTVACGGDTWRLDNKGSLTLLAECGDFDAETSAPWRSVWTKVKEVGFDSRVQNKYIGNNAFKGYTNLGHISSALSGVGANAFSGCTKLSSVDLSSCTSVGANAFANTAIGTVDLTNAKTIGANAFANSALVKVTWGTVLQSLGSKAFQGVRLCAYYGK